MFRLLLGKYRELLRWIDDVNDRSGLRWNRILLLGCGIILNVELSLVAQNSESSDSLKVAVEEPGLTVAGDLRLERLLREPIVANPLYISFDERGRMWLVQYRQYPWPAGLKLVSRDNVWRNVYDPPFPPPPPHALDSPFRGADRITIHEDTNQDGMFDRHTTFLEGLNFATAALPGRGGVFVMNPPYLLFYQDQNRDDVPDSDEPEILLSGFGIEDSHSIANSLRWGPDGWIYATQGSTVSGSVVVHLPDGTTSDPVHSMGQNVWRYHPEQRRYEVFAEGGGNAFGVEIDSKGRVYSGHNGGNTRGFYYVQGGYSQKTFGKHGELSNPYAFDYYRPMKHHDVVRFTHTFCIYESTELPARYQSRLIGVNPVENYVVLSDIGPDGAARRTTDVGFVIKAGEGERSRWFTPVDIQSGPDGALYVADWFSVQANHYKNHEGQTNPDLGRIYRLTAQDHPRADRIDLASLSTERLVGQYLQHPNRWYRMQVLRLLGDRKDASVVGDLTLKLKTESGADSLNVLWALNLCGGFDDEAAQIALRHSDGHVRRWAVRLLGDRLTLSERMSKRLVDAARVESDVESRCQLASTAARLSADQGLPILFELLKSSDHKDPYVPNMIWWGFERHCDAPELVLDFCEPSIMWNNEYRVGGYSIPQNLMRRFALAGRQVDLEFCARLLSIAPNNQHKSSLVEAFTQSFEGRALPTLPDTLARNLADAEGPFADLLAVRRGELDATVKALKEITDSKQDRSHRLALIRAICDVRKLPEQTLAALRQLVERDGDQRVRKTALLGLQKFNAAQVPEVILNAYNGLPDDTREVARQVLASRSSWAKQWLKAVDEGRFAIDQIQSVDTNRMYRHRDAELRETLARMLPRSETPKEAYQARIDEVEAIVREGKGTPLKGQSLFHGKANCGKCHRLFHRGSEIGPDLTAYNRTNLRRMLLAIVHPNAEVREGFESYTAYTVDGRVLSGIKLDQNQKVLILRGADGQDQSIAAADIDELNKNNASLMPDELLGALTDEEVRDLFAFLTSTTPPK